MDALPIRPPAKYRLEHRDGELTPLILGLNWSLPGARSAMAVAVTRLQRRGEGGWVYLIAQEAAPEVELARRKVHPFVGDYRAIPTPQQQGGAIMSPRIPEPEMTEEEAHFVMTGVIAYLRELSTEGRARLAAERVAADVQEARMSEGTGDVR